MALLTRERSELHHSGARGAFSMDRKHRYPSSRTTKKMGLARFLVVTPIGKTSAPTAFPRSIDIKDGSSTEVRKPASWWFSSSSIVTIV